MHYTVALVFSPDKSQIALIRKQKPRWQFGKLNGIGGKINDMESPLDAAQRELFEEANIVSRNLKKFAIGTVSTPNNNYGDTIFFFTGTSDLSMVHSNETEQIEIISVYNAIHSPDLISNLRWLILLALDESTEITKFEISKLI